MSLTIVWPALLMDGPSMLVSADAFAKIINANEFYRNQVCSNQRKIKPSN